MKKIISFIILGLTIIPVTVSAQPLWQWAYKAGGTTASNNVDVTYGVAKDAANNIYSCGAYQGTATIGNNTWTTATRNAWVGKQNADGQWLWSVTGAGIVAAQAITVDGAGNVIVCGSLTGSAALNGYGLNPSGGANIAMFVVKLNGGTGAVMWGKVGRTITSGGSVDAFSVTTDNANNVYVGGRGKGMVIFDGALSFTSSSGLSAQTLDGYVLKLNAVGTVKYVSRIYGATTGNNDKNCYSVITDTLGHVYALGYFQCATARLDATYFISNVNASATSNDVFIAKYDTAGTAMAMYRYASATTSIQDFGYNIKMVNDTVAVFAGQSNNLATLTKVNLKTGAVINAFTASGNGSSAFYAIDLDINKNVYATGFVSSDNATGQNFGTTNLKTNAQTDLLFTKTDNALVVQSAINFGSTSASLTNELGRCIVNFGLDDNIIGGVFASTLTLGITNLSAQGNSDLLIARYAPCTQSLAITLAPIDDTVCAIGPAVFSYATNMSNYSTAWYKNGILLGSSNNDTMSVSIFSDNDFFYAVATSVCGAMQTQGAYVHVTQSPVITSQPAFSSTPHCMGDTVVFVVGASGSNLTYQWRKGTNPISGATNDSLIIIIAGSSSSGTYNCVVSNQCGFVTSNNGSISTISYQAAITASPSASTICSGSSASINPNSVSNATTYQWFLSNNPISGATSVSYIINSMQASDVGTYMLVAYSTCGNDTAEVSTLSLGTTTVLNSSTITGTSCPGSDMIYALDVIGTNLTYQWFMNSNPLSGETNDSLVLSNISTAMNGPYQVNINGACGSVNAGVATLSVPSFNTGITSNGVTLTTDEITAQSYQWIDCNNGNQPIAGENGLSFTPTLNGSYAVVMTNGACSDTSVCTAINSIGLKNDQDKNLVKLYPNPASDLITIEFPAYSIATIYNVLGQEALVKEISKTTVIDISVLEKGIYYLKLSNGASIKFIKE